MSDLELDVLRAEYVDDVIGERIDALLRNVVSSIAPHYPAREYTQAGVWNEGALQEAAQEWIVDRLLERGDLGLILGSAKTSAALKSMLSRSFRQHLINKRTRSSATNLFDRMVTALRENFICVDDPGTVGEQRWALEAGIGPASGEVTRTLIVFAGTFSDEALGVVRYGPYSLKSSPILRGPQLRDLLETLLSSAEGSVSTSELFTVLRHRFNLATLPPKDLDSLIGAFSGGAVAERPIADLPTDAHMHSLAQAASALLTDEQKADIRLLADSESIAAASSASGRSRHNLQQSLEGAYSSIAQFAESVEEAMTVQQIIVESLYEGE